MALLPGSLFWSRADGSAAEHALVDTASGLVARGTLIIRDPTPTTIGYELSTAPDGTTATFAVSAEGAGWSRTVALGSQGGLWTVRGSAEGDLDAALSAAGHAAAGPPGTVEEELLVGAFDVALEGSALTDELPVRRLGIAAGEPGVAHRVSVALVRVPSLEVVQYDRICTLLADGVLVRFADESGAFDVRPRL